MNISIPFNKEITFKTSIAEICSISLEHDVSINDNNLLGDFIISGEYKNLDVNVDRLPFEHVIPFKVDLDKDIIMNTLNYDIEDFTYDIKNEDTLNVNIVLHVSAEKDIPKIDETIFEKEEEKIEDRFDLIEEPVIKEKIEEDIINKEDVNIIKNTIINNDYITYHIHYVKINETIDSISKEYKIDKEKLLELNDISNLEVGDKIIIPDIDE